MDRGHQLATGPGADPLRRVRQGRGLEQARPGQMPSGAMAEEYRPDVAGLDYRDTVTDFQMSADDDLSVCIAYASWLSRDMGLRLLVGYVRWLDIHAASRAGQRQGHLALG
jgi:hypothetical protein